MMAQQDNGLMDATARDSLRACPGAVHARHWQKALWCGALPA
jgi:hypothetical protein